MKIACPTCNAAYEVPAENLAPGRGVRCARCSNVWPPIPAFEPPPEITASPAPPAAMLSPAAPPPSIAAAQIAPELNGNDPFDTEATPAHLAAPPPTSALTTIDETAPAATTPTSNQMPVRIAWAATVALLALAGWLAITRQADIVQAWPPSERAYAALGIHPR